MKFSPARQDLIEPSPNVLHIPAGRLHVRMHRLSPGFSIGMRAQEIQGHMVPLAKFCHFFDPSAARGGWPADSIARIDFLDCLCCVTIEPKIVFLGAAP